MTKQTEIERRLRRSTAEACISRLCTRTLIAILTTVAAVAGFGQAQQTQPEAAKPAKQVNETKHATPAESNGKVIGGYLVHQEIELGGRIVVDKTGSEAMWATMVNQSTGLRVLNQYLDMHSMNPSKTPFFDKIGRAHV